MVRADGEREDDRPRPVVDEVGAHEVVPKFLDRSADDACCAPIGAVRVAELVHVTPIPREANALKARIDA